MQITAIILAGGQSKRMGTDKALLKLEGVTMLERVVELCKIGCENILISSNNPKHAKFGFPVVTDEFKNCGPISGIHAGLKKSETDWNFIISVDAPFVEPLFLNFLISEINDSDAVVPIHDKGKEPLIALYHKNCTLKIEKRILAGDFIMHDLVTSLNTKLVDSENWLEKYPKIFQNINRPCDL
jgi:molybdopterin-guanine dinucleotide biosynthesis protein A